VEKRDLVIENLKMSLQLFDLSGKTALVTGSTQGIGFALAQGLSAAGASIVLHGRNREKLQAAVYALKAKGATVFETSFDVTNDVEIREEMNELQQKVGVLDIVVNNAGIVRRTSLVNMELKEWNEVISTDLTSAFLVSKYAVVKMMEQKRGKIINICSLMSEVGRDTVGAYAAAKGGLKMLTKSMATEWGEFNIQVNGIGPGFIETPINVEYRTAGNPLNDFIISRTPANRWGKPEDLVGAVIFLASAASNFINGQIIYADGGLLATVGKPTQS